jgi:hypothetical protein
MKPRIPKQPEITLISPEGKPVRRSEYFECPEVIIIGKNGVSFDGWVFRTDGEIVESDIAWLAQQIALIHTTQGPERAEALGMALERLIRTPRGNSAPACVICS